MQRCTPEEAGFASTKIESVNDVLATAVADGTLAGIVTMAAKGDKLFHFEQFGVMDIDTQQPMQPDSIFRIASMTKPITCVAALMLYEEGLLDLHAPIDQYISEFKNVKVYDAEKGNVELKRPLTIHHLLTHTSGMTDSELYTSPVDSLISAADMTDPDLFLTKVPLPELVDRLASCPLVFQPGSAWRYGYSHDVLAYIVQTVSGMPFDQFLRERIFQPLSMIDTGYYVPEDKWNRLTTLYTKSEKGMLSPLERPGEGRYSHPHEFIQGGGGLASTASDYMRFCQMLLNGGQLDEVRLLNESTVEMMTTNQLAAAQQPMKVGDVEISGYGYGYGVRVLQEPMLARTSAAAGEYGWSGVTHTYFWIDPDNALIGIFLAQFLPPFSHATHLKFREGLYQAMEAVGQ